jgi:hypothetical protein
VNLFNAVVPGNLSPTEKVIEAIRRKPGLTVAELRAATQLPQKVIDEVCDLLLTEGRLSAGMRLQRRPGFARKEKVK